MEDTFIKGQRVLCRFAPISPAQWAPQEIGSRYEEIEGISPHGKLKFKGLPYWYTLNKDVFIDS